MEPHDSAPDLTSSPPLTLEATRAGMILGAAGYMSPEQARGKTVDHRSDIWAFGVVYYEMLTGRTIFEGETVSDTLAAVLRAEIDWSQLPPATPEKIRRQLVRRTAPAGSEPVSGAVTSLENIFHHARNHWLRAAHALAGPRVPALPREIMGTWEG